MAERPITRNENVTPHVSCETIGRFSADSNSNYIEFLRGRDTHYQKLLRCFDANGRVEQVIHGTTRDEALGGSLASTLIERLERTGDMTVNKPGHGFVHSNGRRQAAASRRQFPKFPQHRRAFHSRPVRTGQCRPGIDARTPTCSKDMT